MKAVFPILLAIAIGFIFYFDGRNNKELEIRKACDKAEKRQTPPSSAPRS